MTAPAKPMKSKGVARVAAWRPLFMQSLPLRMRSSLSASCGHCPRSACW